MWTLPVPCVVTRVRTPTEGTRTWNHRAVGRGGWRLGSESRGHGGGMWRGGWTCDGRMLQIRNVVHTQIYLPRTTRGKARERWAHTEACWSGTPVWKTLLASCACIIPTLHVAQYISPLHVGGGTRRVAVERGGGLEGGQQGYSRKRCDRQGTPCLAKFCTR